MWTELKSFVSSILTMATRRWQRFECDGDLTGCATWGAARFDGPLAKPRPADGGRRMAAGGVSRRRIRREKGVAGYRFRKWEVGRGRREARAAVIKRRLRTFPDGPEFCSSKSNSIFILRKIHMSFLSNITLCYSADGP